MRPVPDHLPGIGGRAPAPDQLHRGGARHDEIMYHVGRPGDDHFMPRLLGAWGIDGLNTHTNVCSAGARTGYALPFRGGGVHTIASGGKADLRAILCIWHAHVNTAISSQDDSPFGQQRISTYNY